MSDVPPDPRTHPPLPPDREHLWWACAFPERPDDGNTVYSDQCPACWLALEAMARTMEPDSRIRWFNGTHQRIDEVLIVKARLLNLQRLDRAGMLHPEDEELRRVMA